MDWTRVGLMFPKVMALSGMLAPLDESLLGRRTMTLGHLIQGTLPVGMVTQWVIQLLLVPTPSRRGIQSD